MSWKIEYPGCFFAVQLVVLLIYDCLYTMVNGEISPAVFKCMVTHLNGFIIPVIYAWIKLRFCLTFTCHLLGVADYGT